MPSSKPSHQPLIGIAGDLSEVPSSIGGTRSRCEASLAYFESVRAAGGVGVLIPPIVEAIEHYLALCDGFVITGGGDPDMQTFGRATHPKASLMHPVRQKFDTMLLERLRDQRDTPTLGVCLGMQLMALVSGGDLDQHLPDSLATHAQHWQNGHHDVHTSAVLGERFGQSVVSHHRQAVRDPGRLNICARSTDGIIEGVWDSHAKFYVGVQWHPERTGQTPLGQGVFDALVNACRTSH